jgi:hypothetical protein
MVPDFTTAQFIELEQVLSDMPPREELAYRIALRSISARCRARPVFNDRAYLLRTPPGAAACP